MSPTILPATDSPITFERIAAFPPPGWQIPRRVRTAPSGRWVTYLQSESGSDEMALFAFDPAAGDHRVLLRASDVVASDKPMSREEELRRERQRKRIAGVTSYDWAARADVMVIPLGGHVYLRRADGTIAQLTRAEQPDIDPQIAADGRHVAFVRGSELFVVSADGEEKQLTHDAVDGVTRGVSDFNGQEEFNEPHGFWWSPDGQRLVYLEVDERQVDRLPVMGYRDGADLQELAYPRAGRKNPTSRVAVVSVEGGEPRYLDLPEDARFAPDDQYLGRFAFSPDGQTLYLQRLSRSQRDLALVRVDLASGEARHIHLERHDAWLELSAMLPIDEGRLLWTAYRDGHRHLELRDGTSGELLRALTSGAWDVTAIHAYDAAHQRVLFAATKESPLERHLYAVGLEGGAIDRLTAEPGVHEVELEHPERGWVDIHSSNDRPPAATIHGPGGEVIGQIEVPHDADFDGLGLRAPELVTVAATADAPELHGALLTPRHMKPGERYPLVVMVYGGPGVQMVLDQWNPRLLWQHLADRGFVVWQVDNRGSTGRGHDFETPIKLELGKVELADQLRGLAHVKQLPYVDPSRVAIYGHSYGGYMAIAAMLRAPGTFQVGIAGSPVTDWRYYDTGYTERYMDRPADNAAGYDHSSLLPLADKLQGKLLIVHALMDENVHFEHTAAMIDAFVAADRDFDLVVFPGERHGYRSPAARRYAYRRVVDYLVEQLGR
ncbi:MAG: alpha/beta fold hydrolase [Polyangiaceae bacterium]